MGDTQDLIEEVAEHIDNLTFEQAMDSYSPDDLSQNSQLVKRLLNHPNPDPSWIKFAQELGRFELAMGDAHADLSTSVETSMQLLMVLTGAQDRMQLAKFARKLKKLESKLPSLARQFFSGYLGGQTAADSQPAPFQYLPTADDDDDDESPTQPTITYETYAWNPLAIGTPSRAPQINAGVVVGSDGANLAGIGEPALGVAVEVDTANKIVKVAVNGQKVSSLPAGFMVGLAPGDELIAVLSPVNGRYLCTMAEAVTVGGYGVGQPCRVVARVLHADAGERSIVVTNQPSIPLPTP